MAVSPEVLALLQQLYGQYQSAPKTADEWMALNHPGVYRGGEMGTTWYRRDGGDQYLLGDDVGNEMLNAANTYAQQMQSGGPAWWLENGGNTGHGFFPLTSTRFGSITGNRGTEFEKQYGPLFNSLSPEGRAKFVYPNGELIGAADNPFGVDLYKTDGVTPYEGMGSFNEPDSFMDMLGLYLVGGLATAGLGGLLPGTTNAFSGLLGGASTGASGLTEGAALASEAGFVPGSFELGASSYGGSAAAGLDAAAAEFLAGTGASGVGNADVLNLLKGGDGQSVIASDGSIGVRGPADSYWNMQAGAGDPVPSTSAFGDAASQAAGQAELDAFMQGLPEAMNTPEFAAKLQALGSNSLASLQQLLTPNPASAATNAASLGGGGSGADFPSGLAEDAGMSMNDYIAQQISQGGGDLMSLFGSNLGGLTNAINNLGPSLFDWGSGLAEDAGQSASEYMANQVQQGLTTGFNDLGNLFGTGLGGLNHNITSSFADLLGKVGGLGSQLTSGLGGLGDMFSSALDRFGNAQSLGTLGAAALGYKAEQDRIAALERAQEKYLGLGAPFRGMLQSSYQPGFSMANEPGYADALDQSSNSLLRRLSASSGSNPYGNPGGLMEAQKYVMGGTALPALTSYRSGLLGAGSMGLPTAGQAGLSAADSASKPFEQLGAGLGALTAPQNDLSSLLKQLKGLGGMSLNLGSGF